jgi:NTE family protein
MSEKKYKTGMVLSGGGARGFAHLGVLKALNEANIFPDVFSGTSAGAIAGALYCDGYAPDEILEIMKADNRLTYMRPTLPREGLLQISGVAKILSSNLHAKNFEELKIPLFVTATDLNNGKAVCFSKGDIITAVLASASIPVLFKPVIIGDVHYVDGGVLDDFPVTPIENSCDLIIGSFVNSAGYEEMTGGLIKIALRVFALNLYKELQDKKHKFDFLVAPEKLKEYGVLESDKADEIFEAGYKATKEKLNLPEEWSQIRKAASGID